MPHDNGSFPSKVLIAGDGDGAMEGRDTLSLVLNKSIADIMAFPARSMSPPTCLSPESEILR